MGSRDPPRLSETRGRNGKGATTPATGRAVAESRSHRRLKGCRAGSYAARSRWWCGLDRWSSGSSRSAVVIRRSGVARSAANGKGATTRRRPSYRGLPPVIAVRARRVGAARHSRDSGSAVPPTRISWRCGRRRRFAGHTAREPPAPGAPASGTMRWPRSSRESRRARRAYDRPHRIDRDGRPVHRETRTAGGPRVRSVRGDRLPSGTGDGVVRGVASYGLRRLDGSCEAGDAPSEPSRSEAPRRPRGT